MFLLVVAGAFELVVVDSSMPLFMRAFAWVKLVKLWAGLRTDDVQGIRPQHLEVRSDGF